MTPGPPEVWLPIPGYEGLYRASDWGRIARTGRGRGAKAGRVLKLSLHHSGYLVVTLCKGGVEKNCLVNRLVAETFIGPIPPKHEVNHLDGDKHNNRADNLEITTKQGNIDHAVKHGLMKKRGADNPMAKLTPDIVRRIRYLAGTYKAAGYGQEEIARRIGKATGIRVSGASVRNVLTGATWGAAAGVPGSG